MLHYRKKKKSNR